MLIGVLSDTHGQSEATGQAVRLLRDAGAVFLVHCGDVGSPDVLDHLAGIPSAFVWGNCDWDRAALQGHAGRLGVRCLGAGGDLELDGRRIAVMHGDDAHQRRRVLDGQAHDYLMLGHSHARLDERVGKVRIVNPGALHRVAVPSVALVDTAADRVDFFELARGASGGSVV